MTPFGEFFGVYTQTLRDLADGRIDAYRALVEIECLGAIDVPSKSQSQARLMAAAAHTPGGYGGVSQKVGKEFNQADKGGKLLSRAEKNRPKKTRKKK